MQIGIARQKGNKSRGYMSQEEKANRPMITKSFFIRVMRYLTPYWKQLILVLGAIGLTSGLNLLPAIITGRIIDEGLIGENFNVLVWLVAQSFAIMLGANLIGVAESYLSNWIAQHITFDMRNAMFKHLLKMPQRFYTTNNQGDIVTRMTSDISGVQQVITNTMTSILSNSLTLIIAVIAMLQKSVPLAIVGMLIIPLFIIPTKKMGKIRWQLTNQAQQNEDQVNGILNETLSVSGQLLVKLYNQEQQESERYETISRQLLALTMKEKMAGRWFRVAMSTFSSVGPLLLYLIGGGLMVQYDANLSVGDITVMVVLLGKMYGPVNSLLNVQIDWIRSMALFSRIFDYFDMEIEIENPVKGLNPTENSGAIVFDRVNFAYDADRKILNNISFAVEAGETVAIVGPSGAGKSSMINLIPRLYDVSSGSITLNGADIRDLNLSYVRGNIGIVTQDTYLFNGTIRDNLLYAKRDATEAELMVACKLANIHDLIMSLPQGYDSIVGNRGLKLSGGEKQRLSIARVLLKNPDVLIFDEATSSLDSISEALIQAAIDPLIKSRTSIMIAHRLSTILSADKILVLDKGQIVAQGSHNELLEKSALYRALYETQFKNDGSTALEVA